MMPSKSVSIVLALALAGCGNQPNESSPNSATAKLVEFNDGSVSFAREAAPAAKAHMRRESSARDVPASAAIAAVADNATAALVALQPPAAAGAPAVARKIVYDAQVDLIVESVDPIEKKLTSLVQESRGYIAEQNTTGSPGSQRSMRWRLRIPVEHFDSFIASITALGELERNGRTSQDVTEQYYDLEARIKNKRVEEQTLNKILQERSGKLEDVLKIEIELSRVRGEIEQFEGKIRVLENLSSLATVTLNVREREKYAPAPPVAADFRTQIARVWDGSVRDLANMGKSLVLWAVSWAVWLPFLIVGAFVGWFVIRAVIRWLVRNRDRMVALARTPITPPRTPTAGA